MTVTVNSVVVAGGTQGLQGPPGPGGFAPLAVPAGSTFIVPDGTQAIFVMPITVDGTLQIDGALIGV